MGVETTKPSSELGNVLKHEVRKMTTLLTSCSIIAHIDVSVTGDIRLDLMLVSTVVWLIICTKP